MQNNKVELNFNSLNPHQRMSKAWRSIIKAKNIVQRGARWSIDNDNQTCFCLDYKLPNHPLIKDAFIVITTEEKGKYVCDYWQINTWRVDILNKI